MTSDGRRGRTVDDLSPADVAGRLRAVGGDRGGADRGGPGHTAYLRGAADVLALVADPPAADQR